MALPRKGSRKIVVGGTTYRWTIRRKATEAQKEEADAHATVAVERVEGGASKLVIWTSHAHPQNYFVINRKAVKPSDVRSWIEKSIDLGWNPSGRGVTVARESVDGNLKLQKG
jgi:hypothetical protein